MGAAVRKKKISYKFVIKYKDSSLAVTVAGGNPVAHPFSPAIQVHSRLEVTKKRVDLDCIRDGLCKVDEHIRNISSWYQSQLHKASHPM